MCWVSVGRFASGRRQPLTEALLLIEIEEKNVAVRWHRTQAEG